MSKKLERNLTLAEQAFRTGNVDLAISALDRVLAIAPMHSRANEIKAYISANNGDMIEAYELLKKATIARDATPHSFYYLGKIHLGQSRYREAISAFQTSLSRAGEFFEGLHDLGLALSHLGQLDDAIAVYDKAAALNPKSFEVHFNKARALDDLGRSEDSLVSYDIALSLEPSYARAWLNRGTLLCDLRRYEDALLSYDKTLALDPTYAEAWLNRGSLLREMKRYDEAMVSFDRALAIRPEYAEAWFSRGELLRELKRYDEALTSCRKALDVKADLDFCYGAWLHLKMMLCDWSGLNAAFSGLCQAIENGQRVANPFTVLATPASSAVLRKCAQTYATRFPEQPITEKSIRSTGNKIRIGYYSADFHNHATMYLMAGLLEHHDKSKFDILGFSFGPDFHDEMRSRAESSMTQFVDVTTKSDREIADLSRKLGIDIAVDLKGYTADARPGIFACRAAPVQVNYLGYPGTMGVRYIDYLVADATLVPEVMNDGYSEQILRLPYSYQPNDRGRRISSRVPTRAQAQLPDDAFVFACFNNTFKITPDVFDVWMRLLSKISHSVLWLFESHPTAAANLRREAEARGVSGERLLFAERLKHDEHLARLRLADLFLDTFYYNAHTTASDALWTGVPVLTRVGETFAGRVAASLLTALGLQELITHSTEEYEAMAFGLATHRDKLTGLKQKLAANRLTYPLFNTELYTKDLERLYEELYVRHIVCPGDT
jgi:protein O-GlcNAc transferase